MYREIVLHALLNRTATGGVAAAAVDTIPQAESRNEPSARFYLNVTAFGGTAPTLDVTLWGLLADGSDYLIGTFTQKNGVIKDAITVADCPRQVYAKYVIGGSAGPNFTFSVQATRF